MQKQAPWGKRVEIPKQISAVHSLGKLECGKVILCGGKRMFIKDTVSFGRWVDEGSIPTADLAAPNLPS
jgi:hypothetical protein